jgi:hypothetical protein
LLKKYILSSVSRHLKNRGLDDGYPKQYFSSVMPIFHASQRI